jgi:hypothetical protein
MVSAEWRRWKLSGERMYVCSMAFVDAIEDTLDEKCCGTIVDMMIHLSANSFPSDARRALMIPPQSYVTIMSCASEARYCDRIPRIKIVIASSIFCASYFSRPSLLP